MKSSSRHFPWNGREACRPCRRRMATNWKLPLCTLLCLMNPLPFGGQIPAMMDVPISDSKKRMATNWKLPSLPISLSALWAHFLCWLRWTHISYINIPHMATIPTESSPPSPSLLWTHFLFGGGKLWQRWTNALESGFHCTEKPAAWQPTESSLLCLMNPLPLCGQNSGNDGRTHFWFIETDGNQLRAALLSMDELTSFIWANSSNYGPVSWNWVFIAQVFVLREIWFKDSMHGSNLSLLLLGP